MKTSLRAIEILLVEDSPTDRLIAVEALSKSRIINSLNVVENGVDAMAYLRREGQYSAARRPDLILLDLNLPKKDGREVLVEIKSDPFLKFIPVVVLTTSKSDEDLVKAYGNHANSYITKPVDFPRFTEALNSLGGYWFEVVTLPPEAAIEQLSRALPPRVEPPRADADPIRILLIEDNPADVALLRDALNEGRIGQFSLSHCSRVEQARKRLSAESFDLIVTDLGLPDAQGMDTYRAVRAMAKGLPIIVLTGFDDEETGMRALREGAQDYLVKGQLTARAMARAARYAIDKKVHQEQLRQSQRLEAVGRLAAGIAHDFNNILTVVRGNADLIASGQATDTVEAAQEICEATDRATSLARQLLTFSRQQAMHAKPLEVNHLVGTFTRMLRRLLGDAVRLELQLGSALPAVLADVGMLEQVLLNLAVNARDAMPGGGKFTIQTGALELSSETARAYRGGYAGRFVRLTAADTGAGIEPGILDQIFEPFFSTKARDQGTGLGLATVYGIMEQHRGWVAVTSQLGIGTSFEIFLPTTDAPVLRSIPPPAPVSGSRHETILFVEDEEALRHMATRVLSRQGYRVLAASSAVEAFALWQEHADSIDLLLTDLMLPEGQSGRQVAEKLISFRPSLRVIFSSGYSPDFTSSGFTLEAGHNFLPKPYDIAQLHEIVRKRLNQEA